MPSVLIFSVDPIRRHFKSVITHHDGHRTVCDPGVYRPAEKSFDLLRFRGRRNIPVFRLPAQDAVTHTAADNIRLVTALLDHIQYLSDFFRQIYLHTNLRCNSYTLSLSVIIAKTAQIISIWRVIICYIKIQHRYLFLLSQPSDSILSVGFRFLPHSFQLCLMRTELFLTVPAPEILVRIFRETFRMEIKCQLPADEQSD